MLRPAKEAKSLFSLVPALPLTRTHQETMSCYYFPLGTMLWVLLVMQFMFQMARGCVIEERIALMRIRSTLVEANSEVPASWGQSDDCCSWERIRCNNSTRVSELNLGWLYEDNPLSNSATGGGCSWNMNLTMFSSFHELQLLDLSFNFAYVQSFDGLQGWTKLQHLDLGFNCLVGNNILESLGKLASLEVLNINSCTMSGALQSTAFENLKNLRKLDLGDNRFSGSIPASLFELPQLEYMDLSENLFQEIPITSPSTLQSSLRELNLGFNQFNGIIPASLFELPRLEYLDLSRNLFQGIPITSPSNLRSSLRELHLGSNQINGIIPASLFELPHLEYLDLSGNLLQGLSIPSPSNLPSSLRELHLQSNQLSGSIPASLFELPRLQYLDLSGNFLQGRIPISSSSNLSSSLKVLIVSENNLSGLFDLFWLWNCTMLEKVDLSGNADLAIDVKFPRRVPLFQLRELMLSGCKLDDSIIAGPNFLGTQSHLRILDLSNNNLTGSIPGWINTTTLVYLNLANNSLVGSLDLIWKYRSNLKMIDISMNRFIGQLPTNISLVFPNLTVLNASYNIISGHLPPSLCNIRNLSLVDLSNNKLTGEVPTCLFTDCTTLELLKLSNNNLGGLIFGGASSLSIIIEEIYLDSNKFEGALPNNLSGNLRIMDLHDNKLSGELDVLFWNLSRLGAFSVAGNNLAGEICPAICKFIGLQFLDVSDNKFSGSIPNCDSKLTLQLLNMSSNTLTGFPSAFCNSSYLTVLDLKYNQFKGSLDWIYGLSQIYILLLGGNKFGGQISPNLCQLQYLNIIDLSQNRLSGLLPPCIGGISFGYHKDYRYFYSVSIGFYGTGFSDLDDGPSFNYNNGYELQGFSFSTKGNLYTYDHNFFGLMSGIDLSANMLSGQIPWEIGNLSYVKSLNLSHNLLTGQIPATFANMSAIESLDLSYNQLSGSIPWQLTQMSSLEVFSVAYNNLSGCIPNSGQFSSFSVESYLGNANLHNLSQGSQCSSIPSPVEEDDDVGEVPADPVLYIISAASFVLAFWATTAFLFCHPFGQRVILQL